jgi:ABC-type uncharacterized transport system substrate-binding protein
MDRRRFLLTPLAGAIAAPLVAEGQQAGKVHRIGVLSPEAPPPGILEGFREGLHELGYVEGKTITIELRHSGGLNDRLAAMAEELVRLRVDAILAINTPAAQAAKKATPSIPIVITRVADPVRTGLVPSLSRPGGNITGLSFQPEELSGKRIELLKETLPGVSRVAALWYTGNPGATIVAKGLESSGVQLGIQILRLPVQSLNDYVGAFETAARGRAGALILVDDAFVTRHRSQILELAAKHSMPVFSLFMPFVEGGGLMAYGPNVRDMYRRAAHYVDKILKGARPADLPVEQATKFDLVVNLRTASALGLSMPQSVLAQATEFIQ